MGNLVNIQLVSNGKISTELIYSRNLYVASLNNVFVLYFVGEFVAQFKFTVLLMPNGPMRITAGPFDSDVYQSDKTVEDEELKVYYFKVCFPSNPSFFYRTYIP